MLIVMLWGSSWVVMKIGLQIISPLNFVLQRLLFSAFALSPLMLYLRNKIPRDRDTWLSVLIFGLINATGMMSTHLGLIHERSGVSAVLTYTQPLFTFCLAVPFLRERANLKRCLGIFIGLCGVIVLYLGRLTSLLIFSYPLFFLILGAFLWAVATVYYKKFLNDLNPIVTNAIQFSIGILVLSVLSAIFEGLTFPLTRTYIFIIIYVSVFASAISQTLWLYLIREEEATVVSSSSFIVPMVAQIFGWVFLLETIDLGTTASFLMILTGVYLVNRG